MFGENDVRRSAAPISSAIEWKALLKMASSMGSVCADMNHQVQEFIDCDPAVGRDEGGRAVFDDHGRALKGVARSQLVTGVQATGEPSTLCIHLFLSDQRTASVAGLLRMFCC